MCYIGVTQSSSAEDKELSTTPPDWRSGVIQPLNRHKPQSDITRSGPGRPGPMFPPGSFGTVQGLRSYIQGCTTVLLRCIPGLQHGSSQCCYGVVAPVCQGMMTTVDPRSAKVVLRMTPEEPLWHYGRFLDYPGVGHCVHVSPSFLHEDTVSPRVLRRYLLQRCHDDPGVATV